MVRKYENGNHVFTRIRKLFDEMVFDENGLDK